MLATCPLKIGNALQWTCRVQLWQSLEHRATFVLLVDLFVRDAYGRAGRLIWLSAEAQMAILARNGKSEG
jgi:hypothetical protein